MTGVSARLWKSPGQIFYPAVSQDARRKTQVLHFRKTLAIGPLPEFPPLSPYRASLPLPGPASLATACSFLPEDFCPRVPSTWSILSSDLPAAGCLSSVKSRLESHLFGQTFPDPLTRSISPVTLHPSPVLMFMVLITARCFPVCCRRAPRSLQCQLRAGGDLV